jgi:hypothetical protein
MRQMVWCQGFGLLSVVAVLLLATFGFRGSVHALEAQAVAEPVKRAKLLSTLVAPGSDGRDAIYGNFIGGDKGFFLVALDPESGKSTQFDYAGTEKIAQGIVLGPDGNLYLGTYPSGLFVRFSPKTGRFETLGRPVASETYVYSPVVGKDGQIYAGTYPGAHLVAVDPRTGRLTDFGSLDRENSYARYLAVGPDGAIYIGVGFTRADLLRFDPETRRAVSVLPEALRTRGLLPQVLKGEDGEVYVTVGDKRFKVSGDSLTSVERIPVAPLKTREGQSFRVSQATGEVAVSGPAARSTQPIRFTYTGAATRIWQLASTPEGAIYGGTVFPAALFRFDPKNGHSTDLGVLTPPEGLIEQVEVILPVGSSLLLAAYPRGWLARYNREGRVREPSLEVLTKLGPGVYRPKAGVVIDGTAYIVGWPEYGKISGGIAEVDLGSWQVRRNYEEVVPNSGLNALCWDSRSRLLVGGTSIQGEGVKPVRSEAVVFGWDPREGKKIFEVVPVPGGGAILTLACGDGIVVGLEQTKRTLFVLDPTRQRVVNRQPLDFGSHYSPGKLGGVALVGHQALIAVGSVLYAFDLTSFALTKLLEHSETINVGPVVSGRTAYFASGATLYRVDLPKYDQDAKP